MRRETTKPLLTVGSVEVLVLQPSDDVRGGDLFEVGVGVEQVEGGAVLQARCGQELTRLLLIPSNKRIHNVTSPNSAF